jgi:hypothetical protein
MRLDAEHLLDSEPFSTLRQRGSSSLGALALKLISRVVAKSLSREFGA